MIKVLKVGDVLRYTSPWGDGTACIYQVSGTGLIVVDGLDIELVVLIDGDILPGLRFVQRSRDIHGPLWELIDD